MAITKKSIQNKLIVVFVLFTLLFVSIVVRLLNIQFVHGEKYRSLSEQLTLRNDTIFANRGNVFSSDGSLLATSKSQYEIRMDLVTVDVKIFEKEVRNLSISLADMFGGTSYSWENKLRKARNNQNRYLLIARKLGYNDYLKVKSFPIFNLGMYKGGFIAEQTTVRAHPLGKVAERTIGYDDYRGAPGIEGAYRNYLQGKHGWRMKQKITKGVWKPISDNNEKEPINGKDIVTTIDVNIQDVAHHSLLKQLEEFEADHGCVIVMETKTGEVKAIANLGITNDGKYYEKRNYAIYESHEPGSTFKLMAMVAALEDKVIDTSTVVDTENGVISFYTRKVRDSKQGGYGEISAARVLELSSNVGMVKLIHENYKDNPQKFVDRLKSMHLDQKIGLEIKGEGEPFIPDPSNKKEWDGLDLPWMAYGYGVSFTPLQTLTFYNAIANNGEMVKPRFVKEIRSQNTTEIVFDKEVINSKICSQETVDKVREILKNVVKRGTATNIYSPDFSMAGKTGTCQMEYWTDTTQYISSFSGFFPAENPKYSCIVVIHKPNKKKGYYGATVAAPVFKDIAQKIYTSNYNIDQIDYTPTLTDVENEFEKYHQIINNSNEEVPNVKGMPVMDAVALLENMGLKVHFSGNGKVKEQSISVGEKIKKGVTINLTTS